MGGDGGAIKYMVCIMCSSIFWGHLNSVLYLVSVLSPVSGISSYISVEKYSFSVFFIILGGGGSCMLILFGCSCFCVASRN